MEEELLFLKNILAQNGYPTRFVEKNMKPKPKREECDSAPKKTLYLNLNFKGDLAADILKRRISSSLKKTFPAATLRVTFSSRPILRNNTKDKLSHMTNSMCIYQFTCSCGARYIGRCMRVLSKRVREHYPAWLQRGGTGSIRNANNNNINSLIPNSICSTGMEFSASITIYCI
uniref:Uncharacterized protein n=1 Tax=Trichobilharzia regenti TaxID=157069 RepID=A0AA85J721_TRIRE|nr:unnamed protein product [Trichobilharzia regenti]